jgi:hypothetical protein
MPKALRARAVKKNEQILVMHPRDFAVDGAARLCIRDHAVSRRDLVNDDA